MLQKIKQFMKSFKVIYQAARWIQTRPIYCAYRLKSFFRGRGSAANTSGSAYRVTPINIHSFFGYYDKCPWNSDGNYLLYLQVPNANRMPKHGEEATIGLIDMKDGIGREKHNFLASTRAWSWQQGAMMQWIGSQPDRCIIFNDHDNSRYKSIVLDIHSGLVNTMPLPVYAVSGNGEKALTLNFDRLHFARPGYGYVAKPCANQDNPHPTDDGIWMMDLQNGDYKLIISLDEIVKYQQKAVFKTSFHYFNHLMFNPCGNRFMFLHLWLHRNVRYSRLITANCDGSDLFCLSDYGMVSHFTWKDDASLLAWARRPQGDRYYLFHDLSEKVEIVGNGVLKEDGHPSFSPNQKNILTDTYPDKERMRSLILYDMEYNRKMILGRYFAPFKFDGVLRCDLHPRWSRNGKHICFDSVHEGYRAMYILPITTFNDRI